MSPRLKRLSGREVVRALGSFGFVVISIRGSHAKVRRALPDGSEQNLTIPLHRELDVGTLAALYRQASQFVLPEQLKPIFYHR